MHPRRSFLGRLASLPLAAALPATLSRVQAAPARSGAEELLVMTFNLRYASDRKPNAWPDRLPVMTRLLEEYQPDIMGTQEGVYSQLQDLSGALPHYAWLGLGRDGGSRGEFMAIFYRRDRFDLLEYDHFWLSDTPEVMASSTWGNTNRRMVTWGRFRDRVTGREFHLWNTHLDHALQPAREKGARLIRERIAKVPETMPLLLTGDFNAYARANPAYDLLVTEGGLTDTWYAAAERRNETANSFNGFGPLAHEGRRIDWILSRGAVRTRAAEVVDWRQGDQWPSDHLPVAAWLKLG